MLDSVAPHATIAVSDMDRAKSWYTEKLDMKPVEEDEGGAWYECGGGRFALFPTPYAGTAQNTVMEWSVPDLDAVVAWLQDRGVTFETFEMEGIDWDGPIASMGDTRGAWFKDSEGNILAVTQARG